MKKKKLVIKIGGLHIDHMKDEYFCFKCMRTHYRLSMNGKLFKIFDKHLGYSTGFTRQPVEKILLEAS